MMTPEQLELFPRTEANGFKRVSAPLAPKRPAGETVPFPAERQIAHVRRVARALDARDERLATKYWRTECNRMIGRLQVQGFAADTIRAELIRFGNAVAQYRADDSRQRPTGGAA